MLEEVIEGLWRKLHAEAQSHRANTEEKRRVYQEFMSRDKKGLAEVVDNNRRILKLTVLKVFSGCQVGKGLQSSSRRTW